MVQKDQSRKTYPSDRTDEQWAIGAPLIPPAQSGPCGGHPRQVDMRAVLNTLFSLNRSGCQWDMRPHALLPKSTGYDYFAQWRDDGPGATMVQALRERTRGAAGREPPRAACIDSQSVKTPEMGGPERGDDGGKKIKGRTRHLLVDTLGLGLAILLTSAGLDEGVAAPRLLGLVTPEAFPRLLTSFADQKDHNQALDAWRAGHRTGWRSEGKRRPEGIQGFTPREKRWVIERTRHNDFRWREGAPRRDAGELPQARAAACCQILGQLGGHPGPRLAHAALAWMATRMRVPGRMLRRIMALRAPLWGPSAPGRVLSLHSSAHCHPRPHRASASPQPVLAAMGSPALCLRKATMAGWERPRSSPNNQGRGAKPTAVTPGHWPAWRARARSPWSMSPRGQLQPCVRCRAPVQMPSAMVQTPSAGARPSGSATLSATRAEPRGARPPCGGARPSCGLHRRRTSSARHLCAP
jgi:putative transposase